MTTVITDGKTMAGDSLWADCNKSYNCIPKVMRTPHGSIMGFSGDDHDIHMFQQWVRGGMRDNERPVFHDKDTIKPLGEVNVLELYPNGDLYIWYGDFVRVPTTAPVATGTGGNIALGALAAGATLREAVAIAKKIDVFTGGRVVELGFAAPKTEKRRRPKAKRRSA